MFCGKCGAKNPDGAVFCSKCGEKMIVESNSVAINTQAEKAQNSKKKNKMVGMVTVFAVLVVGAIVIFAVFGGRGYKATADKFMDSIFSADAKAFLKLIPGEVAAQILEDEGYGAKDTDILEEELQDVFDDMLEAYEGWSYTYKIISAEDFKAKALHDLQKTYEQKYDLEVESAKTVVVELTISEGKSEQTRKIEITVIKIGRSWYIDFNSTF